MKSCYKYCDSLKAMLYTDIKAYHMQHCIDSCGKGYGTQASIKNLFTHLDRYAYENDIIQKQYSSLLTTAPLPETNRKVFTDEEIRLLWNNINLPWVDSIIFLLYTGFRISEMLNIKLVDIEDGVIKGGVKTAAGKNRLVPIHSKIEHIVSNRINQSKNGYLFEYKNKKISSGIYRRHWSKLMKQLDMRHIPHECRHTLRTRLDRVGANKVCIDRILGHKSQGTGERVYTHKTIEELKSAIELITD